MSYELGGENAVPFSAHGADYVVRKSGSEYLAEGRLGNQDLHNDSLVALWDAIYGEVAEPTIQFTRGVFTVDGVLRIQGNNTTVLGMGEIGTMIQADDSLNDHIFEWDSGDFYYNIFMQGFQIDGNRDNQGAVDVHAIDCDITAACTADDSLWSHLLRMNRVTVKQVKGTGIYFKNDDGTQNALQFSDLKVSQCTGATETKEVYIERMFDGYFINSFLSSMELQKGVTTNHFANLYFAGGGEAKVVVMAGCTAANPMKGNMFVNVFFDNPKNGGNADSACLSIEDYAKFNFFHGCNFGRLDQDSTTNISPQLQLDDDTLRNFFTECAWYYPPNDAIADQFKYAIEEKGNSDYNYYSGAISRYDRTGAAIYGTGYWSVNGNSDVDGLRVI